jgi:hypothetical protein
MRLEVRLPADGVGRYFTLKPRGAVGEDVPLPATVVPVWTASVPSVADVLAHDLVTGVVTPKAPGTSLVTVTTANCPPTYINVTVYAPALDHVDVEQTS